MGIRNLNKYLRDQCPDSIRVLNMADLDGKRIAVDISIYLYKYEGDNMLVINPDECIDCGVCEPECPVDAIRPDTIADADSWIKLNDQYSRVWPNITIKRDSPVDADLFKGEQGKLEKYFSPDPGQGD